MKILYAKFEGYIGFNAEMGLDVLEIDFTKCKYNICLIVGMNGSGKSTLIEALSIFPDGSSSFMTNKDGAKHLRLVDRANNLYEISILSPSDGKGGRKTTKAFIKANGVELNPNGNVSSYKEIVFNEFELDSNYMGLSLMSFNDRGLGDKKPAERKKFVSSIIDNLVTYNNMYKSLNKKSLLYKSHINTLHTKIQTAGNKEALENNLKQLQSRENTIRGLITQFNNEIVTIQAKNTLDPQEMQKLQDLNTNLSVLNTELSDLENQVSVFYNKTKIKEDEIIDSYLKDKELLNEYGAQLEVVKTEWKNKQEQIATTSNTITQLKTSISDININENLEKVYSESNTNLKSLEKKILSLGINTDTNYNELQVALDNSVRFIKILDSFYEELSSEDIAFIVNEYADKSADYYQVLINSYQDLIDQTNMEINQKMRLQETVSILNDRPSNCKIDSCPFISKALEISKETPYEKLEEEVNELVARVEEIQKQNYTERKNLVYYQSLGNKYLLYQRLLEFNIMSEDDLNKELLKMSHFNTIRAFDIIQEQINLLKEYESEYHSNQLLGSEYKAYRESIKLFTNTTKTIEKLESENNELIEEVSGLKVKVDKYSSMLDRINENYNFKTQYYTIICRKNDLIKDIDSLKDKINDIQSKLTQSPEAIEKISTNTMKIKSLQEELDPVLNNISDIKGRLTLLDSYFQEYETYNSSYQFIEVLKKYCSPTGGGIQTIFMQIYMAKTLDTSNKILSMLFGGIYQLLDFVITENEFRIPFQRVGGLPVDDISSGSNSQISMFGMVINLVLLHQASTKFNIARLDEIDNGLDHRNRFEFIPAMYKMMQMLEFDQLFAISHSMEADMTAVDVVKLKMQPDDFGQSADMGNVIFDYNELIK